MDAIYVAALAVVAVVLLVIVVRIGPRLRKVKFAGMSVESEPIKEPDPIADGVRMNDNKLETFSKMSAPETANVEANQNELKDHSEIRITKG